MKPREFLDLSTLFSDSAIATIKYIIRFGAKEIISFIDLRFPEFYNLLKTMPE